MSSVPPRGLLSAGIVNMSMLSSTRMAASAWGVRPFAARLSSSMQAAAVITAQAAEATAQLRNPTVSRKCGHRYAP